MRSNDIINLYRQLLTLSSEMETALCSHDFDQVSTLTDKHNSLMNTIMSAGIIDDMRIQEAVEDANRQVLSVINTIRNIQKNITAELSASNNRRMINSAYLHNVRSGYGIQD